MANKLQIKRTTVAGRVPNTTNGSNTAYIDVGELAINTTDGLLYSSNGSSLITIGNHVFNGGAFTANVSYNDNVVVGIGTGSDVKIYHDGTDTFIDDVGSETLKIRTSGADINIQTTTGSSMATFTHGGDVKLYFNGNQKIATLSGGASVTGDLTATGDITAFSDERLKSDIETLDGNKVFDMRGVTYTKDGKQSSGVIAQELEKIAPELVNSDGEYKSVAYGNLTGYLIEAIKLLQKEIDDLKNNK